MIFPKTISSWRDTSVHHRAARNECKMNPTVQPKRMPVIVANDFMMLRILIVTYDYLLNTIYQFQRGILTPGWRNYIHVDPILV